VFLCVCVWGGGRKLMRILTMTASKYFSISMMLYEMQILRYGTVALNIEFPVSQTVSSAPYNLYFIQVCWRNGPREPH
jgi:hypothetical protein